MRLVSASLAALVAGCSAPIGQGAPYIADSYVELPNTELLVRGDIITRIKVEEIPYINDVTYVADPSLLLGKIAVIRADSGTKGCSLDSPSGRIAFEAKIAGLVFTNATTAQLQQSVIVNRQIAASIDVLSYLSAELDSKSLYKLIVTDERSQRVNDNDPSYANQRATFLRDSPLTNDVGVCWLLQVDGYTHKAIARTMYTQVDKKAAASFAVRVNGGYFASNENYQLDHRFGLSFSVLRRPDRGLNSSTALTTSERRMLVTLDHIPDRLGGH